jgi:hypothetical protein
MSKEPIIMFAQPDDEYFLWQSHLYIENCITNGFDEERIHVLLYNSGREPNTNWDKLKTIYPKLNIYRYNDRGVVKFLGIYIPILRPHILWQHFDTFPELSKEVIIYTDCDILWTKNPNLEKFYEDDVCYVSDASSYLNYSYFLSKEKQVLPDKLEEYKRRDVIQQLCDIVGINKQLLIDNDKNTGGVQYIFKNIDAPFWRKIQEDTLSIRSYLLNMNKEFYKSENDGWQSWCADLWAIQFNLWMRGKSKVINELSFCWAPDSIEKLKTTSIYHNAGVTAEFIDRVPYFYKGKYHMGSNPMIDPHLQEVINNEESRKKCTWFYASALNELDKKYKLSY